MVDSGPPQELGLLLEIEADCKGDELASGWFQRKKKQKHALCITALQLSTAVPPVSTEDTGRARGRTYSGSYSRGHCLIQTCKHVFSDSVFSSKAVILKSYPLCILHLRFNYLLGYFS